MSAIACPHCGCKTFTRRVPMRGFWVEYLGPGEDGETAVLESNTDELTEASQPATMKCDGCGKRIRNPDQK